MRQGLEVRKSRSAQYVGIADITNFSYISCADENIERDPVVLDLCRRPFEPSALATPLSSDSVSSDIISDRASVPPRREYVWRTIDQGQQSLDNIARRISQALDIKLSPVNKLALTNGRSVHRCAGYVRE